jgi:hypothetical protein
MKEHSPWTNHWGPISPPSTWLAATFVAVVLRRFCEWRRSAAASRRRPGGAFPGSSIAVRPGRGSEVTVRGSPYSSAVRCLRFDFTCCSRKSVATALNVRISPAALRSAIRSRPPSARPSTFAASLRACSGVSRQARRCGSGASARPSGTGRCSTCRHCGRRRLRSRERPPRVLHPKGFLGLCSAGGPARQPSIW